MYAVGQRVRCKVNDKDYRLFIGDMGTIVEINDRAGDNSFITVEWDRTERMNLTSKRDLGWWIHPQRKLPDGSEILHVVSNLELFDALPDTREYLEYVATFAR